MPLLRVRGIAWRVPGWMRCTPLEVANGNLLPPDSTPVS